MSSLGQKILEALQPRGVRERIKLKLSKGFTASQILNRLPLNTQTKLKEESATPQQAQHHALSLLDAELNRLKADNRVYRQSVILQEQDGRGVRRLRVDVWRT